MDGYICIPIKPCLNISLEGDSFSDISLGHCPVLGIQHVAIAIPLLRRFLLLASSCYTTLGLLALRPNFCLDHSRQ